MGTEAQNKSRKQEMRITKSFKEIRESAHQTIGSGNKWFQKSDVVTNQFRVEAKTKVKPSTSINVKKEWYDKIRLESFETGQIGLVAFSFGDGEDYISMRIQDFLAIVEELNELRERCK